MPKSIHRYKSQGRALKYRNHQRLENYKVGRKHCALKPRREWDHRELKLLRTFVGTDRELALVLNRSVQAIQVKRCKLNYDRAEEAFVKGI